MKSKILLAALSIFLFSALHAQVFISKAKIEYEVKTNIQKTIPNFFFANMLKDQLPQFKTGYYDYTFAGNKSVYKFDHWSDESRKIPDWFKREDEDNIWYCDFSTGILNMQKNVGSQVNIQDSLQNLQWRITNDTRVIAGFNCRKAFTIIFDSVYVFAFYTDEIMISGGPCSIHGLPGMILGMTVPRLYSSWIATKVTVNDVDAAIIKPVKARKTYDTKFLESAIKDNTKDWYSDDATQNAEIQKQKAITLWLALL